MGGLGGNADGVGVGEEGGAPCSGGCPAPAFAMADFITGTIEPPNPRVGSPRAEPVFSTGTPCVQGHVRNPMSAEAALLPDSPTG